jgi:transcriptional regulator of nitric oxide reductase
VYYILCKLLFKLFRVTQPQGDKMKSPRYVKLLSIGVISGLLTVTPVLLVQYLVQRAASKVPSGIGLPESVNAVIGLSHATLFMVALVVSSAAMTVASVVYARRAKRRNRVVPAWVHD